MKDMALYWFTFQEEHFIYDFLILHEWLLHSWFNIVLMEISLCVWFYYSNEWVHMMNASSFEQIKLNEFSKWTVCGLVDSYLLTSCCGISEALLWSWNLDSLSSLHWVMAWTLGLVYLSDCLFFCCWLPCFFSLLTTWSCLVNTIKMLMGRLQRW